MDEVTVDGQAVYSMSNMVTTNIAPVELNAIMFKFERNLARIAQMLVGYA